MPGVRVRRVAELGLVGHPQLLLRAGYPAGAGSPTTGRRSVEDVLTPPTGGTPEPAAARMPDAPEPPEGSAGSWPPGT